ncbi:MAG TPA: hypothetical protein VEV45_20710 [Streptosporangiaceae bacterium]|nr:hypothetical protein [Streptosporangiaceae bacterium]
MAVDKGHWAYGLGLDADQLAFYENKAYTPARALCRGTGRHEYHLNSVAELARRGELPPGVELIPLANGTVEIRDWCKRQCGRYASILTDEEGTPLWDTRQLNGERDYIGTGLGLRGTGADSRYLHHLQEDRLRVQISKRLKIAQRAKLQAVS